MTSESMVQHDSAPETTTQDATAAVIQKKKELMSPTKPISKPHMSEKPVDQEQEEQQQENSATVSRTEEAEQDAAAAASHDGEDADAEAEVDGEEEEESKESEEKPDENIDELMLQVPEKIEEAAKAFALGRFEVAIENYSSALEILSKKHGDHAPECAEVFFMYGKSLLANAMAKNQILGDSSQVKTAAENVAPLLDTPKKAGVFVFEGDGEDDEEEAAAADAEGDASAEAESGDDLQLAWEALDLARVIYSSMTEDEAAKKKLGDVHLLLGDVSLESELWDQAIDEYQEVLKLKKEMLQPEDRQLAEAHYKLALAYELAGRFDEAVEEVKATVSVLKAKVESLEKQGDVEGKGKAPATEGQEAALKEIAELKELFPEMDNKIEELKSSKESAAAENSDEEGSGEGKPATKKLNVVHDVSNLVKKKSALKTEAAAPAESTETKVEDNTEAKEEAEQKKRKFEEEEGAAGEEAVKKAKNE
ncbi:hypothetical protein HK102_002709 [Quaeritorhiza haematococci]|nr:hypothetical protein HK102_002709 [Quaeritorhiza haematococci]